MTCWCGREQHDDPFTELGHELITAARIPQLSAWLARVLIRRPR